MQINNFNTKQNLSFGGLLIKCPKKEDRKVLEELLTYLKGTKLWLHSGDSFTLTGVPEEREFAKDLARAGVDVILTPSQAFHNTPFKHN